MCRHEGRAKAKSWQHKSEKGQGKRYAAIIQSVDAQSGRQQKCHQASNHVHPPLGGAARERHLQQTLRGKQNSQGNAGQEGLRKRRCCADGQFRCSLSFMDRPRPLIRDDQIVSCDWPDRLLTRNLTTTHAQGFAFRKQNSEISSWYFLAFS